MPTNTLHRSQQLPTQFLTGTSASQSAKKAFKGFHIPFASSFLPLRSKQSTVSASPEESPASQMESPPMFERRLSISSSSSEESDGIKTPDSPFNRLPAASHDNISWDSFVLPGPSIAPRKEQQQNAHALPYPSAKAIGKRKVTAAPAAAPNDSALSISSEDTLFVDIEAVEPFEEARVAVNPREEETYEDERLRGRSPWPRILWSSEISTEALGIIENYHKRAMGTELPRLPERGQRTHSRVGRWSRQLEKAGL